MTERKDKNRYIVVTKKKKSLDQTKREIKKEKFKVCSKNYYNMITFEKMYEIIKILHKYENMT